MAEKIVVYSQPDCAACARVKEFLSRNNIEFTDRNVREDRAAMLELLDHGFRSTPVTMVGDDPIVG